ncbi:LacI family DNA-binding transcriptional regulator [Brachybacterium sp. MASK1Z-5]|uniref:LacI family DNA-binding transcriptional regulator n=1 Tax=Brachybacterium halotolerans TaxID=2795215 RepID=A0ABS1BA74_9MICO|nr:LacI family DNA-binding transcriptional regulator [Brachybacterium halotolerans]MBK0331564.1 LacI family DNA-binding transcriptional regulator [Brachybacterium halotolerans]
MPGGRVRKAPTIVEIARDLGVSSSTVSRAFTAPRLLKPETVERIRAAAAERGYIPNVHARALSTGVPRTIGLIVPDIANPFFPPMIRAAQRVAEQSGHTVLIADTDGDVEREKRIIERLAAQSESLIIASSRLPSTELVELTDRRRVLFINRDEPDTARILVSARDALCRGVDRLLALGHRRFAYVGGPAGSWSEGERHGAVVEALQGTRALLRSLRIPSGTYEDTMAAGEQILLSGPTAVIAFDDVIAHGVIDLLHRRGISVPEQISVVGCDDTLALTTQPPLASIALRAVDAARLAVQIVSEGQVSEMLAPRRIALQGELVERATVGAAPETHCPGREAPM